MNPSTDSADLETRSEAIEVAVADDQSDVVVDPEWLRHVTRSVLAGEGVDAAQISIALVDDAAIHEVNRQFLGHDYPTDVISFPLGEPMGRTEHAEDLLDGEIVVSTETARCCASEHGCQPSEELALYVVHGLLHLCGYDDRSEGDRRQMRQREKSHLKKLGIPANYGS